MGIVLSLCNQKGGVGKTTSAINIATLMGEKGYKTLLIDLDSQGNATSGVGIEKPSIESTAYQLFVENFSDYSSLIKQTEFSNLFLIPANMDLVAADLELVGRIGREFVLKNALENFKKEYDFIFLDCPPSLGLVSINSLVASNYIIIPLQCEYYALEGLGQLLQTYELVKKNLNTGLEVGGVVLTMADFRTNLTQQVIEEVKNYFQDKVFKAVIPRAVKISEAPSFGKPAVIYDSHNRASVGYQELAKEFDARFGRSQTSVGKPEEAVTETDQVQEKADEIPEKAVEKENLENEQTQPPNEESIQEVVASEEEKTS